MSFRMSSNKDILASGCEVHGIGLMWSGSGAPTCEGLLLCLELEKKLERLIRPRLNLGFHKHIKVFRSHIDSALVQGRSCDINDV